MKKGNPKSGWRIASVFLVENKDKNIESKFVGKKERKIHGKTCWAVRFFLLSTKVFTVVSESSAAVHICSKKYIRIHITSEDVITLCFAMWRECRIYSFLKCFINTL